MKTLTLQIQTVLTALFLIVCSSSTFANNIEIQFAQAHFDANNQELYVDVQVRNTENGRITLAGQNYRFYYDSEVLELDTDASDSNLPVGTYGEVTFEDHMSGVDADHVNQLSFDDNLGFANFSIELLDPRKGGVALTKGRGWMTIATLKFEVKKENAAYDVVWGREGVSELYATAFVEMGQWVSANKLDKLNIVTYGDLSFTPEADAISGVQETTVKVGPNPASDFVEVSFAKTIETQAAIIIRDLSGKQMKQEVIRNGSSSARIDISDLVATTYFVEVYNSDNGKAQATQIIVAK